MSTRKSLTIIIFFISFAVHLSIAGTLYFNNLFTTLNLLFDSDSVWYLSNFETGTGSFGSYGGHGIIHPNVANLVHAPIAIISDITNVIAGEEYAAIVTKALSIAAVPFVTGLATSLLFLSLTTAGFDISASLIAVILSLANFSGLLFGSMPESFGLTGAFMTFVLYLTSQSMLNNNTKHLSWLIAGTALLSITITNIVPFAGILAITLYYHRPQLKWVLMRTGTYILGSVALCVIIFIGLTAANSSFDELRLGGGQIREIHSPSFNNIYQSMEAPIYTLFPPLPQTLVNLEKKVVRFTFRDDIDNIISSEKGLTAIPLSQSLIPRLPGILLLLVTLTISLVSFRNTNNVNKPFFISALFLVGYNFLFHIIFGNELFLYSQHWLPGEIVVISLAMLSPTLLGTLGKTLVSLIAVLAAIHSIEVFRFILSFS